MRKLANDSWVSSASQMGLLGERVLFRWRRGVGDALLAPDHDRVHSGRKHEPPSATRCLCVVVRNVKPHLLCYNNLTWEYIKAEGEAPATSHSRRAAPPQGGGASQSELPVAFNGRGRTGLSKGEAALMGEARVADPDERGKGWYGDFEM